MTDAHKRDMVNLDHARHDDQRDVMQRSIDAGECPFCLDNLRRYHRQEILKETHYWLLTYNQWPYPLSKPSLLLISKTHAERLQDLDTVAGTEMLLCLQWAERAFCIQSGVYAMRFGDTKYNGATVAHLHCHIIVPDTSDPQFETMRFKVGTKP
jgi:diadenosine tetraphosphate (Ap4A) HIT family hydrolase